MARVQEAELSLYPQAFASSGTTCPGCGCGSNGSAEGATAGARRPPQPSPGGGGGHRWVWWGLPTRSG